MAGKQMWRKRVRHLTAAAQRNAGTLVLVLLVAGFRLAVAAEQGKDRHAPTNQLITAPISLTDAISITLRQSPSILKAQKDLEAAEGIVTIANANMSGAIRSRTVQKGRDPREFALAAFTPAHGATTRR